MTECKQNNLNLTASCQTVRLNTSHVDLAFAFEIAGSHQVTPQSDCHALDWAGVSNQLILQALPFA